MIREATRRLRQRLPAPLVGALRRVIVAWGMATVSLRPPPEIIVVGAQRAGTTTLFRLLSEHPQLRRPTVDKGTGYFDDAYRRGPRWYRAHFPVRRPGGRQKAFECSGYYLFHPLAAERIARDLPGCQVVVMVRDPVARAYSAHRHELARGYEGLGFSEAVALESERTRGLTQTLAAEPAAASFAHRHHCYLQRGHYAEQVQRFVDALGADRVHVIDADVQFADPIATYLQLQERLGLSPYRPAVVGRWNERPGPTLPADLELRLRAHFEPHDAALAQLIGHVPSWRREEP